MKDPIRYDFIVIGGGTGADVAQFACRKGQRVALIEEGPLGGTCLNRGCIPSKMLIHAADVARTIATSGKHHITSTIESVDIPGLIAHVSDTVDKEAAAIEEGARKQKNLTLYKARGKFVDKKILEVEDTLITADTILIAAGTRPFIPPIPGLDSIPFLTSTEALRLQEVPKHLVVVGGGYIATELAYFFTAMGVQTTILTPEDRLLSSEDSEISEWFTHEFSSEHTVRLHTNITSFKQHNDGIEVLLDTKDKLSASHVLLATGRMSNADILNVKATGVETNAQGFVNVTKKMETSVPGISALGDITGIIPLKHTANHQAITVIKNVFLGKNDEVDYRVIPHAVFSRPQVAGVGKTEQELGQSQEEYVVGKAEYKTTGMGKALQENGLVKVLAKKDGTLLGCHIVGPEASSIIQEAVVAMNTTGNISAVTGSVHIHPALPEVIQRAFAAAR